MSVLSVRRGISLIGACALAAGGLTLASPAQAAQSVMQISCEGTMINIRANNNNSSGMGGWSSAQIVDFKGHLTPTDFAGSLTDDLSGATLFSFDQVKGGGNASNNQQQISCSSVQTGTAGDFFGSEPLPDGVSADDPVTFTILISAVPKA